MQAGPFEQLKLNYNRFDEISDFVEGNLNTEQKQRLKNLFKIIDGFESTFSLEILSSVHFLKKTYPGLNKQEVLSKIHDWNDGKKAMIEEYHVELAYEQLDNYGREL